MEGKDNQGASQEEGIEDCEDNSEGPQGNAEQGTAFKSSFAALNQMQATGPVLPAEESKADPTAGTEFKAEEKDDFNIDAVPQQHDPGMRGKLKNATQMLLAPLKVTAEDPKDKEQRRRQKLLEFDPRVTQNSELVKKMLRRVKSRKYSRKFLELRDRRIDLLVKKSLDKNITLSVLEDCEDSHHKIPVETAPGEVAFGIGDLVTDGIKGAILFPKQPYKVQETLMRSAFQAAAEGKNAMLESPTGTGKTLCLLAACLEAMRHINGEYAKIRAERRAEYEADEEKLRLEEMNKGRIIEAQAEEE